MCRRHLSCWLASSSSVLSCAERFFHALNGSSQFAIDTTSLALVFVPSVRISLISLAPPLDGALSIHNRNDVLFTDWFGMAPGAGEHKASQQLWSNTLRLIKCSLSINRVPNRLQQQQVCVCCVPGTLNRTTEPLSLVINEVGGRAN